MTKQNCQNCPHTSIVQNENLCTVSTLQVYPEQRELRDSPDLQEAPDLSLRRLAAASTCGATGMLETALQRQICPKCHGG